jgi:hypothetical protein
MNQLGIVWDDLSKHFFVTLNGARLDLVPHLETALVEIIKKSERAKRKIRAAQYNQYTIDDYEWLVNELAELFDCRLSNE